MTSPLIGNQHLLDMLDEAKKQVVADQEIRHASVVLSAYPNRLFLYRQGEVALEKVGREGLQNLIGQVNDSLANAMYPMADSDLDASYACYNMATGPLAFDMLIWLVFAEMRRRAEGGAWPLKVGFWLGNDPSLVMGDGKRMRWLEHVYRPALAFVGAVEDDRACRGWHTERYTMGMVIDRVRRGEETPQFSVPESAPFSYHPGAVTITLREADHWPHRNSDIAAWLRFAHDLRWRGENVVFIRDTAKAMEPMGDFETDPLASFDLTARMARYASAKANLFVSNGPATLAVFSDKPWLQFIPVEPEESGYASNRASFWKHGHGVGVGEQYPWSTPSQRIVWERETYRGLHEAWEQISA